MRAFIVPLRLALALFGGVILWKLMPGVVRAEHLVLTACERPAAVCHDRALTTRPVDNADAILMPVASEADLEHWLAALKPASDSSPNPMPRKFTYPEPDSQYEWAIAGTEQSGPTQPLAEAEALSNPGNLNAELGSALDPGGNLTDFDRSTDPEADVDPGQLCFPDRGGGYQVELGDFNCDFATLGTAEAQPEAAIGLEPEASYWDYPHPVIEEDPLVSASNSDQIPFGVEDSGEGWDRGEILDPCPAESFAATAESAQSGMRAEDWLIEESGGEKAPEDALADGTTEEWLTEQDATWKWYDFRGYCEGDQIVAETDLLRSEPETSPLEMSSPVIPEAHDPWCYYGYHLDDISRPQGLESPAGLSDQPADSRQEPIDPWAIAETQGDFDWTVEESRASVMEAASDAQEESILYREMDEFDLPGKDLGGLSHDGGGMPGQQVPDVDTSYDTSSGEDEEIWDEYGEWSESESWAASEDAPESVGDLTTPGVLEMSGQNTGSGFPAVDDTTPWSVTEPVSECPLFQFDEAWSLEEQPADETPDLSSKYLHHYEIYRAEPDDSPDSSSEQADPAAELGASGKYGEDAQELQAEPFEVEHLKPSPEALGRPDVGVDEDASGRFEPGAGISPYRYEYWQYREQLPYEAWSAVDETSQGEYRQQEGNSSQRPLSPADVDDRGLLEDDLYWHEPAAPPAGASFGGSSPAAEFPRTQLDGSTSGDALRQAAQPAGGQNLGPSVVSQEGQPDSLPELSAPPQWMNPELWLDEDSLEWLTSPQGQAPEPAAEEIPAQKAEVSPAATGDPRSDAGNGQAYQAVGGEAAEVAEHGGPAGELFWSESPWQVAVLQEQYARLALAATSRSREVSVISLPEAQVPAGEIPGRLPILTGIQLFASRPEQLLTPADFEVLRYTRLLAERSTGEAQGYFHGYLSTLGWHAFDLAGRLRHWQGQNWPATDAGLATASLLLATCRLVERGELGVEEAGRVLEQSLAGLPTEWTEALLAAIQEAASAAFVDASQGPSPLDPSQNQAQGFVPVDKSAQHGGPQSHSPAGSAGVPADRQKLNLGAIWRDAGRYLDWIILHRWLSLLAPNSWLQSWFGGLNAQALEAALFELAHRLGNAESR